MEIFVAQPPKSSHPNVPPLLGSSPLNKHHMKKQTDKAMQGNTRKQLLQKFGFALEI